MGDLQDFAALEEKVKIVPQDVGCESEYLFLGLWYMEAIVLFACTVRWSPQRAADANAEESWDSEEVNSCLPYLIL